MPNHRKIMLITLAVLAIPAALMVTGVLQIF